jgi:hypothetical protein
MCLPVCAKEASWLCVDKCVPDGRLGQGMSVYTGEIPVWLYNQSVAEQASWKYTNKLLGLSK